MITTFGSVTASAACVWILMVASVAAAIALPDEDLMRASPLTVAQCRAGCLHKLIPSDSEATDCENRPDCWKCWKYCEVLRTEGKNTKKICENKCDTGCREACSFHDWHGSSQPSPVVEARGEKTLTVDAGTTTLRWPRPAGPPSPPRLVYVVMRRREPGTRRTWSQLAQTAGHELRLPKTAAAQSTVIRVLAVSVEGLTTIYSPPDPSFDRRRGTVVSTTSTTTTDATLGSSSSSSLSTPPKSAAGPSVQELRDADIIIRSLGRDQILGIRLPLAARSAPQEESLRLMGGGGGGADSKDSMEAWNLREVSMIHQKVLVIAEVAWDARQVRRPAYLVTWEIAGGGLKGNLFTDTTCVTLSLWPDTAYIIQVSLLGGADDSVKMSSSPTLMLDTRSAVHSKPAVVITETTTVEVTTVDNSDGSSSTTGDDWVKEDVMAKLSAPEASASLRHAEWQLMAATGLGVALFLLLAVLLVSCRTASPVVSKGDPECPPLLDEPCDPPSLDLTKYLNRCRMYNQRHFDGNVLPSNQSAPEVLHVRH